MVNIYCHVVATVTRFFFFFISNKNILKRRGGVTRVCMKYTSRTKTNQVHKVQKSMKSWIGEKERKPNIVTQSRRVLRKKSLNLKLISLNPQNAGYSSPSKYTTSNNVVQPSKQQEPVWTTKNHHSISVTQFPSLITHFFTLIWQHHFYFHHSIFLHYSWVPHLSVGTVFFFFFFFFSFLFFSWVGVGCLCFFFFFLFFSFPGLAVQFYFFIFLFLIILASVSWVLEKKKKNCTG